MRSKQAVCGGLVLMSLTGCLDTMKVDGYQGPKSDHFNGTQFLNLDPVEPKSLWVVLKWRLSLSRTRWPKNVPSTQGTRPPAHVHDGVRYTFINHASFLIQVDGLNILTDPIWSERTSPFSFMGPKRVREPGIPFEQLPKIDVVLISHNHYDHLDVPTLQRLQERDGPLFIAGLGNRPFLEKFGLKRIQELDWWKSTSAQGAAGTAVTAASQTLENADLIGKNLLAEVPPSVYKITSVDSPVSPPPSAEFHFVPVRHWSRRGRHDFNKTLWGGFVIKARSATLFFAGDTGYGSHFQLIHDQFPKIDLAFLPMGAYEPRWFMKDAHMNPEEAVRAHLELRAFRSVGMHFGTFQLSDEKIDDPQKDLEAAKSKWHVAADSVVLPEFGQGYFL